MVRGELGAPKKGSAYAGQSGTNWQLDQMKIQGHILEESSSTLAASSSFEIIITTISTPKPVHGGLCWYLKWISTLPPYVSYNQHTYHIYLPYTRYDIPTTYTYHIYLPYIPTKSIYITYTYHIQAYLPHTSSIPTTYTYKQHIYHIYLPHTSIPSTYSFLSIAYPNPTIGVTINIKYLYHN